MRFTFGGSGHQQMPRFSLSLVFGSLSPCGQTAPSTNTKGNQINHVWIQDIRNAQGDMAGDKFAHHVLHPLALDSIVPKTLASHQRNNSIQAKAARGNVRIYLLSPADRPRQRWFFFPPKKPLGDRGVVREHHSCTKNSMARDRSIQVGWCLHAQS